MRNIIWLEAGFESKSGDKTPQALCFMQATNILKYMLVIKIQQKSKVHYSISIHITRSFFFKVQMFVRIQLVIFILNNSAQILQSNLIIIFAGLKQDIIVFTTARAFFFGMNKIITNKNLIKKIWYKFE